MKAKLVLQKNENEEIKKVEECREKEEEKEEKLWEIENLLFQKEKEISTMKELEKQLKLELSKKNE